jgi:hypothetical protein
MIPLGDSHITRHARIVLNVYEMVVITICNDIKDKNIANVSKMCSRNAHVLGIDFKGGHHRQTPRSRSGGQQLWSY